MKLFITILISVLSNVILAQGTWFNHKAYAFGGVSINAFKRSNLNNYYNYDRESYTNHPFSFQLGLGTMINRRVTLQISYERSSFTTASYGQTFIMENGLTQKYFQANSNGFNIKLKRFFGNSLLPSGMYTTYGATILLGKISNAFKDKEILNTSGEYRSKDDFYNNFYSSEGYFSTYETEELNTSSFTTLVHFGMGKHIYVSRNIFIDAAFYFNLAIFSASDNNIKEAISRKMNRQSIFQMQLNLGFSK